jgi:hypothetical protein
MVVAMDILQMPAGIRQIQEPIVGLTEFQVRQHADNI